MKMTLATAVAVLVLGLGLGPAFAGSCCGSKGAMMCGKGAMKMDKMAQGPSSAKGKKGEAGCGCCGKMAMGEGSTGEAASPGEDGAKMTPKP